MTDGAPAVSDFAWTADSAAEAARIVALYPAGRQASAIMPLLWLAQSQMRDATGSAWLPVPVIEFVARQLGMPYIRAYEVASFYTMYNLKPVGRFHVQVCGTTPCQLRGSDEIMRACNDMGLKKGAITADGLFTLTDGADQRRQFRGSDSRQHDRNPGGPRPRRGTGAGQPDRPHRQLP
jgi:NADH-quinone oxidoreductase subunit E